MSNSSTSSFVFRGFDYSEEFWKLLNDDDREAFLDDLSDDDTVNYLYGYDSEYGWCGDTPKGISLVIGEFLTTFSDENYQETRLMTEADDFEKNVEALRKRFKAKEPLRWWEGVMSS